MKVPKKIETERLLLVPMSLEYSDDVFREFTFELTRYMTVSVAKTVSDTKEWIESTIIKQQAGTDYTFAILLKETDEFLGGGGIHHLDRSTPELGIWIKKSSHGSKYGLEAMQGAKKWADGNLDYEYILYPVAAVNTPSRNIAESFGGKVERQFIDKNSSGEDMELVEYRIYKK